MFKDRTFQYYKNNGGAARENLRPGSQTAPSVRHLPSQGGGAGGRVRVQAGDKCVPPAKSRPKRRKNLLPNEQGGLSMDAVQWSDTSYSVREIVQHFGSSLPVLAKVKEGYAGEVAIQYTMGQVVQIHSFSEQERIRVRTTRGRMLSVPLDYPAIIKVILDNSTEQLRLEDAIRKYSLPMRTEILSVANGANTKHYDVIGDEWRVVDTYEDLYLKVNNINEEGWIDQGNVGIIPSFLNMRVVIAVGMSGASEDEWMDYQNMFARSVRHINYHLVAGYDGVVPLSTTDTTMRTTETLVVNLSSPNNNSGLSLYQNVAVHDVPASVHVSSSAGGQKRANQYENIQPSPKMSSASFNRKSNRYGTTQSELEVQDMFQDVLNIAQENDDDKRRSQTLGAMPRHRNVAFRDVDLSKGGSTSNINSAADIVEGSTSRGVRGIISKFGKSDSQDSGFRSTSRERLRSDSRSPHRSAKQALQDTSNYDNHIPGNGHLYENMSNNNRPMTAPKAVVTPTVVQSEYQYHNSFSMVDLSSKNNNNDVTASSMTSHYHSMEDIPSDLDSLSVEQVCECLSHLNMEVHIKEFRRQQVDGPLLRGLNENLLQKDFNFTEFNASKLMRFVRGWRPRFS